jgi:hypothetical protein
MYGKEAGGTVVKKGKEAGHLDRVLYVRKKDNKRYDGIVLARQRGMHAAFARPFLFFP